MYYHCEDTWVKAIVHILIVGDWSSEELVGVGNIRKFISK